MLQSVIIYIFVLVSKQNSFYELNHSFKLVKKLKEKSRQRKKVSQRKTRPVLIMKQEKAIVSLSDRKRLAAKR